MKVMLEGDDALRQRSFDRAAFSFLYKLPGDHHHRDLHRLFKIKMALLTAERRGVLKPPRKVSRRSG